MADPTTLPSVPPGEPDIQPVSIVAEMRTSFLDYAMSVIVARALPDVRDGLKPVHRRILWGAYESGFIAGKPYRKSARIVGDVMGKYHPHGDSSIYDALARMAQDWSMRLPLVDGQGNFGSMDPDAPAGDALHRGAAGEGRRRAARPTSTRTRSTSSPTTTGRSTSRGSAGALPEPAGQRRGRHRGRHGDQHPAA